MTDAEINLEIAQIEYPDLTVESHGEAYIYFWGGTVEIVDYCNNWSDIGPIIEREKIDLEPLIDGWCAGGYSLGHYAHAKTPTKAAALCYLKMKGE